MERNSLYKQIPDNFYSILISKHRDIYLACAIAVYDAVILHENKGLSMADCRDLIALHPEIDFEDGELGDAGPLPAPVLNHLRHRGWLATRYEDRVGEDIVYIPGYCKPFILLFKSLQNDEEARNTSILNLYGAIHAYHFGANKDVAFLVNALEIAQGLAVSLSSSYDTIKDAINLVLQAEDAGVLLERHLDALRKNGAGTSALEKGKLLGFCNEIIEYLNDEISDTNNIIITTPLSDQEEATYEQVLNLSRRIIREVEHILRLNETIHLEETAMTKRALQKYSYMNSYSFGRDVADLRVLLSYLGNKKKDGDDVYEDMLCDVLRVPAAPDVLQCRPVYEPINAADSDARVHEIPEGSPFRPIGEFFQPKYSREEMLEFRKSLEDDTGTLVVNENTITTEDRLNRFIYLYFTSGSKIEEMTVGDYVEIGDGLGFSSMKLKLKEKTEDATGVSEVIGKGS